MRCPCDAALASHSRAERRSTLTKLQRQPEFPQRAQVQELLGLARERSGQLAHAKAEYQEYLRRYPRGEAVGRVRMRLRILHAAAASGRAGIAGGRDAEGWTVTGGASQLYRHDRSELETATSSIRSTDQSALFNDADVLARRRGQRTDLTVRASAGYTQDLLPDGPGNQTRVSTAYVDVVDRALGIAGRLGRQSRAADGVLGTFDGLALSYRLRPAWYVEGSVGMPVESTQEGPETERQFSTAAVRFAPEGSAWDVSTFATVQRFDGLRDRQAAGLEMSYFVPARSLVALLDYDTSYSSLNAAVLIGTLQLPARWTLSLDVERRNSPVLTTRNALVGQPVTSLATLRQTFSDEEIHSLARDRTQAVTSCALSMSKPLGERFQITADVLGTHWHGTPASGGVQAQPATGLEMSWQTQLLANSLLRSGDFHSLALRYDTYSTGRAQSLGLATRMPLLGAWRVGPRLRIDRRESVDRTTQLAYLPALRIDYQRERRLFELELGAELGHRDRIDQAEDSQRYFLGLGYRIGF